MEEALSAHQAAATKKINAGKEADAIYGDFAIVNDLLMAVVANPVAGRNANMNIRHESNSVRRTMPARDGAERACLKGHEGAVYTLAFCNGGDRVQPNFFEWGRKWCR